ncbi:hypothetical protein RV08_GL001872 [Enterococcus mundtii]|nr:hypothetical protein RV08_GL001872 [Enterococcus mundtii]
MISSFTFTLNYFIIFSFSLPQKVVPLFNHSLNGAQVPTS